MPRKERPLDHGDSELLSFARDLRSLRAEAGGPTYREMSIRAGVSPAALSTAAAGRKLPSLAVTMAYVRACGGDVDEWERRWRAVTPAVVATEADAAKDAVQPGPYVGLATFQQRDADRFFGRDRLVESLVAKLAHRRFVAVIGASGSGKSSLIRAGLLPVIERQGTTTLLITPGPHPLRECARLAGQGQFTVESVQDPASFSRAVEEAQGPDFLLVVDQFEEVFTLCQHAAERAAFIATLLAVAESGGRLVIGLRADFYGHCGQYANLAGLLADSQLLVGPMATDELREAITQPAVAVNCTVETGLVARLIADATGQPGMLPLVSHALMETWRRRRGNTLTLSGYEAAGGVHRAITQSAEDAYAALDRVQQNVARRLFLRLIAFDESAADTKRRVPYDELDIEDPDTAHVLEHLAGARLITLDRDTVEIAHEALIRSWQRLRDWLGADRAGLRAHRQLTEAAEAWESVGRDGGALFRGVRLSTVSEWVTDNRDALTSREWDFLDASRRAAAEERAAARRRSRRLRQLVGVLSVLLVLAVTAGIAAIRAQVTVEDERNTALSQKAAGEAAVLRLTNPALAAQLSLAAYRLAPTSEARGTLLSFFAKPYAAQLRGHTGNVNTAAFRPDGTLVATASVDRTVRLWDVAKRHQPTQITTLVGHTDNVLAVAFSPDGRLLATAGWDRTVVLWDVTDPLRPNRLATLLGHLGQVLAVAFSPDGKRIATAGVEGIVRLWGVADPQRPEGPVDLSGHTERVTAVTFTPDGRDLITAGWDGTARLWNVRSPGQPRVLKATGTNLNAVAVSPDGQTFAVAGSDATIKLWSLSDPAVPTELATLTGHTDALRGVAFSPTSRELVSGGADRVVRVWSVEDPRRPTEVMALDGHTNVISSVAFGKDGQSIVTTSDDRTVRLWDWPGSLVTSHQQGVCRVGFKDEGRTVVTASRDQTSQLIGLADSHAPGSKTVLRGHSSRVCGLAVGRRMVVTGSSDRTVRIWDMSEHGQPSPPRTVAEHNDDLDAVAMSPDGKTLAIASDNHTTKLLDVTDPGHPKELVTLRGHTDDVHAIAFSPDGRVLATTSWDHTVRLWDIADARQATALATLNGHAQAVYTVAFAPDGKSLASAGADRTVRLWDITDPRAPKENTTLVRHTDAVNAVAFSRDGRTLATGAFDHTVRLWNLTDPAKPHEEAVLTGHADRVYSVAFSPDGHRLITGSADRSVRMWETDAERVASRVCDVAYPRITQAEWSEYFPSVSYQAPC